MSFEAWLILLGLLVVFFLVLVFWWTFRRLKRLSPEFVDRINKHMSQKLKVLPEVQQIVEYDKVLDWLLKELWYTWTLSQKLQKYQKIHPISKNVWNAHRERNNLVHEIGYQLSPKMSYQHARALEEQIVCMLKRGY